MDFFTLALEEICSDCTLDVSANGEELIDNLRNAATPPDIIFIDVNMPRLDGLSALEAIKKMEVLKSVPIVVYSTSSNRLSISRAYENGASYYFVKPSSFTDLKEDIRKLLETNWKHYSPPPQLNQFVLNSGFAL